MDRAMIAMIGTISLVCELNYKAHLRPIDSETYLPRGQIRKRQPRRSGQEPLPSCVSQGFSYIALKYPLGYIGWRRSLYLL